MWGWATWQRAWKSYDMQMKNWPEIRETDLLLRKTGSRYYANRWKDLFDRTYDGKINTWDYQVVYMLWIRNQLCVAPKVNLVSNIGFDSRSTHTKDPNSQFSANAVNSISTPLSHPRIVRRNWIKDKADLKSSFGLAPSFLMRFREAFHRNINQIKKRKGR